MEQTYKPKTKLRNETSVEAAVKEVFEDIVQNSSRIYFIFNSTKTRYLSKYIIFILMYTQSCNGMSLSDKYSNAKNM